MQFFTSPNDLRDWVVAQGSGDVAAKKILEVTSGESQQDVVDTCRAIFENKDDNASKVLFGVLAKYKVTQQKEGKMKNEKLVKQAQMMRQDSVYGQMPMRICPKLPFSVGKRLISTYNCRHYCLDNIVLDDNPMRDYCAEALWRRHIMDKFAREWKDKDGKWVGGYINERFQVYHDDGGNNMQLAHGERTRKPRPHQFSTERRLEEGRGNETYDTTPTGDRKPFNVASSQKVIKLAAIESTKDDSVYQIFSDIIEMKEAGLSDEDILSKVSEHYAMSIPDVAAIHKVAMAKLHGNNGTVYSCDKPSMTKTAQALPSKSTLVTKREVQVTRVADGKQATVQMETPVVMVSDGSDPIFQIVDGPDTGQQFKLREVAANLREIFGILDDVAQGTIQEAADETGLNGDMPSASPSAAKEEFPITEIK